MSNLLVAVAAAFFVAGAAAALLAARNGLFGVGASRPSSEPARDGGEPLSAERVPFVTSVDALAGNVGALLGDGAGLTLLALYAGRKEDDSVHALLRAREAGTLEQLPDRVPAALLSQLRGPRLASRRDLAGGLAPERAPDAADAPSLVAVLPWRGPLGWQGLVVARVAGGDARRAFALAEPAVEGIGARVAVLCELNRAARAAAEAAEAGRAAAARAFEPPPARETAPVGAPDPEPPAPGPVLQFYDDSEPEAAPAPPAAAPPAGPDPIVAAERRMAELLVAPRAQADVTRAAVSLLFDGLGADRCYAVEMGALRPRAVEHERRREAAASAVGLDLGPRFVDEVRSHARDDFGAVVLTGSRAGELLTAEAFVRLRPSSQLAVPIVERGRTVAVFVAEREGSDRGWSDAEVGFAERVVARAAAALAGVERLESLAQQVGHAREEQEQMEGAMRQLQAVVTALPDALVGVDAEGRITFANRAAGRLLGVGEFDLIGRWLAEVASDLGGASETWERVLAASTTERHTASLRRGGSAATVHVTVVPSPVPGVFDRLISLSERPVGVA